VSFLLDFVTDQCHPNPMTPAQPCKKDRAGGGKKENFLGDCRQALPADNPPKIFFVKGL
jgi:hypothetical protein